jgi:hypothetical protein
MYDSLLSRARLPADAPPDGFIHEGTRSGTKGKQNAKVGEMNQKVGTVPDPANSFVFPFAFAFILFRVPSCPFVDKPVFGLPSRGDYRDGVEA